MSDFDWRELVDMMKDARDKFRAKCWNGAPGDHGEAMKRHGHSEGMAEQIEIVRNYFTEREPDEDGDKPDNPRDED